MKCKHFFAAILAGGAILATASAHATVLTETYTCSGNGGPGNLECGQFVAEGETYVFGFQMTQMNDWSASLVPASGTNSNLALTTDANGGPSFTDWSSAVVSVDFFSIDDQLDIAQLALLELSVDGSGLPTGLLGPGTFDISTAAGLINLTVPIDPLNVAEINSTGTVLLAIRAPFRLGFENDYEIQRVSFTAVPEPAALTLLGIGLLGLGISKRRALAAG